MLCLLYYFVGGLFPLWCGSCLFRLSKRLLNDHSVLELGLCLMIQSPYNTRSTVINRSKSRPSSNQWQLPHQHIRKTLPLKQTLRPTGLETAKLTLSAATSPVCIHNATPRQITSINISIELAHITVIVTGTFGEYIIDFRWIPSCQLNSTISPHFLVVQ